jgi:cyclopropane-fatty-acyl-phospholipid synthase
MNSQKIIHTIAQNAQIEINGPNPWDIQVHNNQFYDRVMRDGSLGFGEAYMAGWWSSQDVEETVYRLIRSKAREQLSRDPVLVARFMGWKIENWAGRTTKQKSFEIAEEHYNLGNELFEAMLDNRMTYSCGYWKEANTIDEAQEAKLDLICRKLKLEPGMRVLDIGCGWGGFLQYASEKYGVEGVGVTVAEEQTEMARQYIDEDKVSVRTMDYRDIPATEQFDAVVSIGMFEHVGSKQYREYMQKVAEVLKEGGLSMVHTIGANSPGKMGDPWITKYIFPNSNLPAIEEIDRSARDLFVMEDWHNFGPYYNTTLRAWFDNFDAAWSELKEQYSERFYRMWTYYLRSTAAAFRARDIQLWQIVFSKGRGDAYRRVS